MAGEPITNAGVPGRRPARTYCIADPTVTTSSSEARMPSDHSLRTYSSGDRRASLVTNESRLPAERSSASASGEPGTHDVLDVHAAVEVEQHVVVGGEQGGEGHG